VSLRPALGQVIREERLRQGLTHEALGDSGGLARETVLRTETGTEGLRLDTVESLASGLGLPVSFLIARAEAKRGSHG